MDIRAFRTTSEVVYSMWCNFLRTRGSGHVFHCDVHNKGRQLTIVGCTILIKIVQIFFASEIGSSIGSIILPSPSCICNEFLRILEIFIWESVLWLFALIFLSLPSSLCSYLDLQECISPSHPLAPVKKAYCQGHHLPFNIGEGHLTYRHRDFQDILRVKGWVMSSWVGGISTTNFCLFRATQNELGMMFIAQNW